MALRQAESSVKVISNGASTVATVAVVMVGEATAPVVKLNSGEERVVPAELMA